MKTSIKQVTKANLHTNLVNRSTLIDTQVQDTISLAYYGLIQGDISSLDDCNQQIVNSLAPAYRKYIPAKWVDDKWTFNKAKAKTIRNKLNIELQATFEEFLLQMNTLEASIELIKEMNIERETEAQTAAKLDVKVSKYLSKALEDGMTIEHIKSLLATIEAKQVKRANDTVEFNTRLADKLADKLAA